MASATCGAICTCGPTCGGGSLVKVNSLGYFPGAPGVPKCCSFPCCDGPFPVVRIRVVVNAYTRLRVIESANSEEYTAQDWQFARIITSNGKKCRQVDIVQQVCPNRCFTLIFEPIDCCGSLPLPAPEAVVYKNELPVIQVNGTNVLDYTYGCAIDTTQCSESSGDWVAAGNIPVGGYVAFCVTPAPAPSPL